MKNKYVKYFLLVLVVSIWGTIAYRIINGLSGNDVLPANVSNSDKIAVQTFSLDTFSLVVDYPDPFLWEAEDTLEEVTTNKKPTVPTVDVPVQPVAVVQLPTPQIAYKGFILNQDTKKKTALLSIEGVSREIGEREKHEEIQLVHIEPGQIIIRYKGKRFTIKRTGNN